MLTPLLPRLRLNGTKGVAFPAPVPFKTPADKPFVSFIPAIVTRPILFKLAFATNGAKQLGRPLPMRAFGSAPLPAISMLITGVTKDSVGIVLGSCEVTLYQTIDDVKVQSTISDPVTGAYTLVASPAISYYIVAYKAGSPDVAGTTVNTLVGT